ncbi:MAG: sigma 54-interacting transcriptional regulator [Deltaproteobacteria bacterium]|nr:sigma 54-interacting transcriptional regulator [Deltaproteobacteria bacterium]
MKKKDTVRIEEPASTSGDEGSAVLITVHGPVLRSRAITGPTVIGREPAGKNDWPIDDEKMSRMHARIDRKGGALTVEDLGSTNGVFVNGVKEASATLELGDVLRLGDSVFVYDLDVPGDVPVPVEIVARSAAMRQVIKKADRVARFDAAVMLLGASGTGKEVLARFIHERSGRKGRFIAINCAALPSELVEATLFGHVKGAFTGADKDSPGLFAEADKGTLFLDEVGELPLALQPKLLRVLETGEHMAVGGRKSERSDVRILSATNVALKAASEAGRFRPDLYARLFGYPIELPLLCERRLDVLPLFNACVRERALGADFVEALLCYDYPLNVRELKALAQRVLIGAEGDRPLTRKDFEAALALESPGAAPKSDARSRTRAPSKADLVALLQSTSGNVEAVAAQLQCHRPQVYRWLKRYQLDPDAYRT